MIHIAYLLDEHVFSSAEIEIRHLTVDELTRDTTDGDDGHIGLVGLSRQLLNSEELLGGQFLRQETQE